MTSEERHIRIPYKLDTDLFCKYEEVSWTPLKPLYCSVCGAEVNK